MLSERESRQKISRLFHKAQERARGSNCPICGKTIDGFCNSHTVPRFVLKRIAKNGKVLQSTSFAQFDSVDLEKGVNNSGTMHIICKTCDQQFFSDYESEDAMLGEPTNAILAQIEIKNTLMQLFKRKNEVELYNLFQQESNSIIQKEILDETHALDIRDYENTFQRALNSVKSLELDEYCIIKRIVLPYVVPLAVQMPIALHRDMYDNIVNDVYDMSAGVRMEDMHLCIFPLGSSTVILMFYHKENKKYDRFKMRFNRMEEKLQLQYINYLLFKYTENYYATPELKEEITHYPYLKQLCEENYDYSNFGFVNSQELLMPPKRIKSHEIPNFLSSKYAL